MSCPLLTCRLPVSRQVDGVRSGKRLNEATEKLKQTITDEKGTMRRQLGEMESRLVEAQDKLDVLGEDSGRVRREERTALADPARSPCVSH